jgi:hypothetical protein
LREPLEVGRIPVAPLLTFVGEERQSGREQAIE